MVVIGFTPSCVYMSAKTLDVNCGSLSVKNFVDMQKLLTQFSRNVMATLAPGASVVCIALVSF